MTRRLVRPIALVALFCFLGLSGAQPYYPPPPAASPPPVTYPPPPATTGKPYVPPPPPVYATTAAKAPVYPPPTPATTAAKPPVYPPPAPATTAAKAPIYPPPAPATTAAKPYPPPPHTTGTTGAPVYTTGTTGYAAPAPAPAPYTTGYAAPATTAYAAPATTAAPAPYTTGTTGYVAPATTGTTGYAAPAPAPVEATTGTTGYAAPAPVEYTTGTTAAYAAPATTAAAYPITTGKYDDDDEHNVHMKKCRNPLAEPDTERVVHSCRTCVCKHDDDDDVYKWSCDGKRHGKCRKLRVVINLTIKIDVDVKVLETFCDSPDISYKASLRFKSKTQIAYRLEGTTIEEEEDNNKIAAKLISTLVQSLQASGVGQMPDTPECIISEEADDEGAAFSDASVTSVAAATLLLGAVALF